MKFLVALALCCIAVGANSKRLRLTNAPSAKDGEYPYQVSLQLDGTHICGGSLISKRHVLTAAHCVDDFISERVPKHRIKIEVGSAIIGHGKKHDVDRISRHGQYTDADAFLALQADIAVIRLKTPVVESSKVKVIGLPSPNEEYPEGTQLIVSGFGAGVFNGPTSQVLRKMYTDIVDPDLCQQYWPFMHIGSGHICALQGPNFGVCQGDSGGPLTLDKQVLVGVVSAVSPNGCGTGVPDIFTKVSKYLDYINAELAN